MAQEKFESWLLSIWDRFMPSRHLMWFVLVALIVFGSGILPADAALRCGSRLVDEGDSRDKLLSECGSPTNVEAWDEGEYEYFSPRRHGMSYAPTPSAVVHVEIWTYNYGPSRFVDYVRIEDGKIRRIYSGHYGNWH